MATLVFVQGDARSDTRRLLNRGAFIDGLTFLDLIYTVPVGALATRVNGAELDLVPSSAWANIGVCLTVIVLSWIGLHQNRAQMAAGLENREWIGVSRFLSVRFFQFLLEVVIVGLYFVMSLRIQLPTSARPQIIQPPMTWLVAVLSLVFVAYLVWDVLDVLQARTNNNSAWQRMAWVGGEVTLVFVALYALCFLLIRITEPTPYAAIWWSVPLAISLYVYRVAQEKAKDKLMMIDLRERAQQAAERAYAPYSKIHVGAAVRLKNGDIFTGVNVENASYGLTICAERAAVFSAVASAGPDISVTALALASTDPRVVSPCGACRQVLHEFGPSAVVILPNGDETTVSALLPGAFDL